MRGITCSKNNDHVKVESEDSDAASSSDGNSDHLSFSYSCVKSFRKNQHIIRDLTALRRHQNYQGITYQPALYSLSGERNRPICQPYYCSSVSESTSDENFGSNLKQSVLEKGENLIKSDYQQHRSAKAIQWLKDQLKQVNTLWSYSISKGLFSPKLCKRNQKMKMEMILNSIDEETKNKLINYIRQSNLGFEEHCNLCNETIFEVDVTSILNDKHRLQNFLVFLKSIESEVSNSKPSGLKNNVNDKYLLERHITKENPPKKNKLGDSNNSPRKAGASGKQLYQSQCLSPASRPTESNEIFIKRAKQDTLRKNTFYEDCKTEVKVTHPKCDEYLGKQVPQVTKTKQNELRKNTYDEDCTTGVKIVHPKHEEYLGETGPQGKKRTRHKSTLSRTNGAQNVCDQPAMTPKLYKKTENQKKVHFEQPCYNVQTNDENNQIPSFLDREDSEHSCKCLMHHNREEYYRYRNMFLVGNGKGDETIKNNTLIKFKDKLKNQLELSVHLDGNKIGPNYCPVDISDIKNVKELKISEREGRSGTKTNIQNEDNNIFFEGFKSESISSKKDLLLSKVSLEQSLYTPRSQDHIDTLKEPYHSSKFSSLTIEDSNLNKDMKAINKNACFESLSHCFDSCSNTTNKSNSRKNIQPKKKQNQNSVENRDNIDSGPEPRHVPLGYSDLNNNTAINEICSENGNYKAKLTINNVDKNYYKSEYDLSKNSINRGGNKNLHSLQNNSSIPSGNEISLDSHGDAPFNFNDYKNLHSLQNNSSIPSGNEISLDSYGDAAFNFNDYKKFYPQYNAKQCCIDCGCDCKKSEKHQPKVKIVVFRMGNYNKHFETNSNVVPKKSKSKSHKAKKICKKISSVFKGNGSERGDECPFEILSIPNLKIDETSNYCSIAEDYNSSPTSTTQMTTPTSADTSLKSSSLVCHYLEMLVSEMGSQRKEIDYIKNLLSNHIT